ncbi:hypothetical protein CDO26_31100 (plasmid) [Sinorhizobium meliloti]|nr:hypothetical protein CDO26_31100 [Sinorhizobium meliloti]
MQPITAALMIGGDCDSYRRVGSFEQSPRGVHRLQVGAPEIARHLAGALTVSGQGFLYQLDFRNIEQGHGNTVHRKAHYKQWLG